MATGLWAANLLCPSPALIVNWWVPSLACTLFNPGPFRECQRASFSLIPQARLRDPTGSSGLITLSNCCLCRGQSPHSGQNFALNSSQAPGQTKDGDKRWRGSLHKNIPSVNAKLKVTKHLIRIKPWTLTPGLPTEEDVAPTGLKSTRESVVRWHLRPMDQGELRGGFRDLRGKTRVSSWASHLPLLLRLVQEAYLGKGALLAPSFQMLSVDYAIITMLERFPTSFLTKPGLEGSQPKSQVPAGNPRKANRVLGTCGRLEEGSSLGPRSLRVARGGKTGSQPNSGHHGHGFTQIQGPTASPGPGIQPHPDLGAHGLAQTQDSASSGPRGAWPLPTPGSRGLTRIQGPTASPGSGTQAPGRATASPGPGQAHPDPGAHGLTRTRGQAHPDPGAHGLTRSRGQAHPDPGAHGLTRTRGQAHPDPGAHGLTRTRGQAHPDPGAHGLTRTRGQAHPDPGAHGLTRTRGQAHPDPGAHGLTRTRGQAHPDPGAHGLTRTRGQAHPDPGAHGLTRTRDPASPGSRGTRPRPDPGFSLTRTQGRMALPGPRGTWPHPDPGPSLTLTQFPASPGPRGTRLHPDPGPSGVSSS
ncbi:hypothetical protein QTO34_015195 [Cnephaeus nilssonii]|uniref:Uncharacterized protein n=1 Tax=Cnephaeus nilssonii TaxID=3371016 RepID=A0AA40I3R0_CNENI|nr:hypothetical protein QTO34_015195 [Eptesicus nilssonii]